MNKHVPWLALNTYPDEILTQPCKEILEVDGDINQFAHDMTQTMYTCDGIGLAAPQVGRAIRLIVMDCSDDTTGLKHFINPEIIDSKGHCQNKEGCLSFPGLELQVSRFKEIAVKAWDLKGNEFIYDATGLEATCLQHEIDHLDGITFLNRVSRQQRRYALRKWEKQKKSLSPMELEN
jgi:peptide deformylase